MGKVGAFVRDPKAGSYCQITLEGGDKIIVNHHRWHLSIEHSKFFGFSSDILFRCDLDSPEGRTALKTLTRDALPNSADATPLGAFVKFVRGCQSAADVRIRCSTLMSASS